MEVDHIRFCLGFVDEERGVNKYRDACDFRRKVLKPAQEELEEYTDLRFEYEVAKKRGKTPISYRFRVFKNVPKKRYEAPKLITSAPKKEKANQPATAYTKLAALSRAQLKAYEYSPFLFFIISSF